LALGTAWRDAAAGAPRSSPEWFRGTTRTSRAPHRSSRVRGITRGRGPSWSGTLLVEPRGRPVVGASADADLDGPRAEAPAPGGVAALRPPASCRGSRGVAPRSDHYLPLDTFPGHPFRGGGAGSPRRGEAGRRRSPRAARYLGRCDRRAPERGFRK